MRTRSFLFFTLFLGLGVDSVLAQVASNRGQFDAQRQGRYAYTPFTAMSSPVVLPMDGKVDAMDWYTGMDVSLGGIFFPHIHVDTAIGTSTGDPGSLQLGHHDPNQKGLTWQNIEFGLSGRFNEYFEAFGTYAASVDSDGHWVGVYEEWFGKIQNIPGGPLGSFELRGGRIYNRFGIQNTYHPHGFEWADQYLVNARLLGEDSLTIIGADITWKLPTAWLSQLDVAIGVAPDHHDHGHSHGGREVRGAQFAAEGALFDDVMTVANWTNVWNYNDFHQYRAGVSGAWGKNESGRYTQVYGVHTEYQWRQNGFEPGGRYLRWRTEAMYRRWGATGDAHDDHDDDHHGHHDDHDGHDDDHVDDHDDDHGNEVARRSFEDFGIYSSLLYGFSSQFELGLRAEYVTGARAAGLDNRFRVSPGATYYLNEARTVKVRLQYNFDQSNEFGADHSVWAQVGFNWGAPEVR